MRAAVVALTFIAVAAACQPPLDPNYPGGYPADPTYPGTRPPGPDQSQPPPPEDPGDFGTVDYNRTDFRFEGGAIDIELRRAGTRVLAVARNHYMVPVMVAFTVDDLANVTPVTPPTGALLLPAADRPNGRGAARTLVELAIDDPTAAYHANIGNHWRFGDPRAQPQAYAYHLPYKRGLKFSVLQGFHGSFSHRGSNEFAVDFQCPVATVVEATREGVVVAVNQAAQGSGTTPEFLEYKRVNFVLVLHDDGTLGEYMHLAPSGVMVHPGQRVTRGTDLALSGNTGYSSTPHLHFQVMTAADDGIAAHSFPFRIAASAERNVDPVQGESYLAWE